MLANFSTLGAARYAAEIQSGKFRVSPVYVYMDSLLDCYAVSMMRPAYPIYIYQNKICIYDGRGI